MTKKSTSSGKKTSYIPDRGDIIWLELDPQSGREQSGRRPCLVLSPALYNGKTGLAVVCPVTNQAKGYSFEVALPAGLKTSGVVLADHIKNLDWRTRQAEFREKLDRSVVREVLDMTMRLLEPEEPGDESNED